MKKAPMYLFSVLIMMISFTVSASNEGGSGAPQSMPDTGPSLLEWLLSVWPF